MSDTRHSVDPKFTYRDKRSGKDVVLYVGLLDAAHRAGLVDVTPTVLQFPHDDNANTCIVMATARFADGRSFSSIGDANPKNVGGAIVPHFIRMAETRAKARALRDALNVGMVTVEELGGDDDERPAAATSAPRSNATAPARPTPPPAAQTGAEAGEFTGMAEADFRTFFADQMTYFKQGTEQSYILANLRQKREEMTEAQFDRAQAWWRAFKAGDEPGMAAALRDQPAPAAPAHERS